MKINRLDLISHVHWDPSWYQPCEKYRIMLLEMFSKLLDALENNPDYLYFHFDGQVSALDDYLEIIPEDEERVRKFIQSGRLVIGPWYIQPEENMISGEAHIRNLQKGIRRAKALGAVSDTSYLCDMVGHIPQMPQIINGFGINSFVGWRGVINGTDRKESEFIWQSPDGSEVLFKVLPLGYCSFIPEEAEGFCERVEVLKKELEGFATTDRVLITCGDDHHMYYGTLPELIKAYNDKHADCPIVHTTLKGHIDYVSENKDNLKIHTGEFRSTFNSFILTGILSTRMNVKVESEKVSRSMERWLEPFSAINTIVTGKRYPEGLINYTWNKQIRNAFHDCIYGASIDPVFEDTLNDYKRINEICEWTQNDNLYEIASCISNQDSDINVTLFNPSLSTFKNRVCNIRFFIEGEKYDGSFNVKSVDKELLNQVINIEKELKYTNMAGNECDQRDPIPGYFYTLEVLVDELPSLGYTNFAITKADNAENSSVLGFENDYLKVTVNDNGSINVFDKSLNKEYKSLNSFEDVGDYGDSYNYSFVEDDVVYKSLNSKAEIEVLCDGPVKSSIKIVHHYSLPKTMLDRKNKNLNCENIIETIVSLSANSKTVDIKTTIANHAENHRIRVINPIGIVTDTVKSGSPFCIYERKMGIHEEISYNEKPMGNYPHRKFVDLSDKCGGVAFMDLGLVEYFCYEDGTLAVTLLRCIGDLSVEKLPERNGPAGPFLKMPDAQLKGTYTFDYALYFHEGDTYNCDIAKVTDAFYASPVSAQCEKVAESTLPRKLSFIECDNDDVIVTAFKKACDDDCYILRLCNLSPDEEKIRVTLFKEIQKAVITDFNENFKEPVCYNGNKITTNIGRYKVVTFKIKLS